MTELKHSGRDYVYGFTKEIIDEVGPRLPGSEEEKIAAEIVAEKMEKISGRKANVEEFRLAPLASIASIPCLGWAGFIAGLVFFLSPLAAFIMCFLILTYAVLQVFTYSGVLDKLWKQHTSRNVYTEILPPDGKYDYTIVYCGHIDSSWLWKHSLKNPNTAIVKTAFGIVGIIVLLVISAVLSGKRYFWTGDVVFTVPVIVAYVLAGLTLISSAVLGNYLTWDKKKASPGAMDNLTGVGYSMFMAEYFKNNPDKHPSSCRIVCAALGSEEAGLKGSEAFVKAHKNDPSFANAYVVNIDSIRDYEHFNVIKGDLWLGSKFDKELIDASLQSMKEAGHEAKVIYNPVGGCDSTPFYRGGYKTVTLIAQNPNITDYYHTSKDTYDNLDLRTLEDFTEVLFRLTDKIAEMENNKK